MVKKDLNTLLATKIIPLYIFLPKISAYRKDFSETKYVSFLIKDNKLLGKYNEIGEKVSNSIKTEIDSNPDYNKKHLRTKLKSYNRKRNTNSQNNKLSILEDRRY